MDDADVQDEKEFDRIDIMTLLVGMKIRIKMMVMMNYFHNGNESDL